jgi:hypothetical protein
MTLKVPSITLPVHYPGFTGIFYNNKLNGMRGRIRTDENNGFAIHRVRPLRHPHIMVTNSKTLPTV